MSGGVPPGSVQGEVGGGPLGGVQGQDGVLAEGVVVQREHGPAAHGVTMGTGRLDGSPVSEVSVMGGGVQFGHGSVALRSIGGRQFGQDERRRPG